MSLLVQDLLKTHSLKDLQEKHGVYASISKSNRKISLNYDQIETKENDVLAWDCRGLILTKSDGSEFLINDGKIDLNVVIGDTKILAFGMRRFFNHGQGSAANIDWSDPNLAILEKLDGTLCIVYYDPFTQKWCVATRSVPEADLFMDNGVFTFRTLFEKACQDTLGYAFEQLTEKLDARFTYCFELTTPYNRIVVNYPHNRITLLAARNLATLQEVNPRELQLDVPVVEAHTYTTISELLDWVSSLNPMEHEGVVVRDANFNRIKVKNAAYVAYNKVRDALGTSERNCMELILAEKDDDVIPMLPEEIVKNLLKIKVGLQTLIKFYDTTYSVIKAAADMTNVGDKKTFALLVQQNKNLWQAPFFQIFSGKAENMKDFIAKNRKDGTWGDSFLDKLLENIKNF